MCVGKRPLKQNTNNALFEWFKNARNNNLPINGNILKLKANDFANLLNIPLKSNNGWLDRFKKRYHIVYNVLNGVSEKVQDTSIEN